MTLRRLVKSTGPRGAPPRAARLRRVAGLCSVWVVLLVAGWGPAVAALFGAHNSPTAQAQDAGAAGSLQQPQIGFLHRLRESDPRYQTIERAVFNAQNELGVILDRRVALDDVCPLTRTLLTQMARAFPGQNLTVIAYAPTQPPVEIGTARLNARTRKMTYTAAVPR